MHLLSSLTHFPLPGNPEEASQRLQHFTEQFSTHPDPAIASFIKELVTNTAGQQLLAAIFGNSPFLCKILFKHVPFLKNLLEQGVEESFATILTELKEAAPAFSTDADIMKALRLAKQQVALLVAIADMCGYWKLEQVTAALSDFAELSISLTTNYLLKRMVATGEIRLNDIQDSGLIVLAMGKLGARELNYSSDVDLILFYDLERVQYTGSKTVQHCFVAFSRDLVKIMEERTADGYVFRMDLRLRPDPGSTPPVISTGAALAYYESVGQNWERMALIKARPIAGDREAGQEFMKAIVPFVWRKYLDFAMIQDIHSVKRQIESAQSTIPENMCGYNIKLGHGGIREIEFFSAIQQLIWGGREITLRVAPTCSSLQELVSCKKVTQQAADQLVEIYRFLRTLEHRLQMVEDHQTHSLPATEEQMQQVAIFMGYNDKESFLHDLKLNLSTVRQHYGELCDESPTLGLGTEQGSLVFTGTDNDPETVRNLEHMGFRDGNTVSEIIRGWHHGRSRATSNKRARELLTELMPALLKSLAATANPDAAFLKFNGFLSRLPAGVQLFSLFVQNPELLDVIAEIMGSYPYLAENLSRKPTLLEYILSQDFYDPLQDKAWLYNKLADILKTARDYEDVLDISRRWTHDRQFRIGIQLVKGLITPQQSRSGLSDIAEAVLSVLLSHAEREFETKHGKVEGGSFVIVGMGKLGSRSLTFGSDIDLVFIYHAPEGVTQSDGEAPLSLSEYYSRLSRRFISAFSALTSEGRLYDIDMRLRPSGSDGPMASTLEAFSLYYDESAWTWEYMALTRARVIAGNTALSQEVANVFKEKLCRPRVREKLIKHILEIREKIDKQYGSFDPWDIKHVRGGLMDSEFIAQFLQLLYASAYPDILDGNTRKAFKKLGQAGIIPIEQAEMLREANLFFLDLQSIIRLASGDVSDRFQLSEGLKEELIRLRPEESFEELQQKLVQTEQKVKECFEGMIGRI